ncbi:hypothetical protein B566_EDAN010876 [Ephemera danica]|nr:hypothetical protein B566_EDAN010876 [Ephemera danica]
MLHTVLQGGLDEDRPFPEHDDVIAAVDHPEAPLPAGRAVLEVITDMAEDERVVVRKAALGALVNLALVSRRWLHNDLIKVLSLHCRDPAMSVRKQVLQGLTMLLKAHGTEVPGLPESWLSSVLPAMQDPEIRVCEFVLELSREVVLDPLQPYNTAGASDLPWQLMRLIPKHDMQNLLISALRTWAKDKLPKNLMSCLESHVGTKNNAEAWMMLSILAEVLKPRNPNFSLTHLREQLANLSPETDLAVTRNIMRVLLLTMAQIKEADRVQLRNLLHGRIQALTLPIELIPISLDLVAATEIAGKNKDAVNAAVKTVSGYCHKLLKGFEEVLQSLLGHQKHNESPSQEQLLVRQVATLGDAVRVAHASRLKVKPRTLRVNVSPLLRAITIITLGKLALQNESIAHELIPAFGLLLDYDKSSVLRNNVLCALADLCGRYAVLVDPLVPRMAACLRSDDVALRKQTLVLMVQLLQEDYVKLRHGLIFFLLRMLCDPEPELQEMTRFYLSENLLKKQPQAMFANLQAALFVFNNHEIKEEDTGGAQGAMLQREMAQLISMQGNVNREARMHIYRFMLETMQDDHRFQTTHRLCMDVLGGFSEGRLILEGPGKGLLRDTLAVLNSDEIRLHSMHAKPMDENDVLDTEEACNIAMVTARKAVVTQVVKRNVMENIIPVIRSLKTKLQAARSPLAEDLMSYLRDLMRDFKSEIKEILAGDRQLAAEVAFDIRQLEERGEPVRQSIAPPRIDDDLESDRTTGTENNTTARTSQGSSAEMSQDSSVRESQDSTAGTSQSSPLATPLNTSVGTSQNSTAGTPPSKVAAEDIEMSSQDDTLPGPPQAAP